MTYKFLGPLVGVLALAIGAGPAMAATVSVEIEGQTLQTPPVSVTTAPAVTKGSYSCSNANSVLSALDAATGGDWDGTTYGPSVPERIRTESHPIAQNASSWAFYVNGRFVNGDACQTSLSDGDKVLWFWSDAFAGEGYDEPLELDAPTTAVPGQPFTVTATESTTAFDPVTFAGTTAVAASPGATISGGTAAATTGADGKAQVTVGAGPYTLVVTKGKRAPARIAGCATDGHDGQCGSGAPAAVGPAPGPCVTNGHDGFCSTPDKVAANAAITAIKEGARFKKGKGPRQLAGKVADDASGLADVRLRLTRNDHGRCATYEGRTEKLKTIKRCGAKHGVWFSVGAKQDFTYLLPSRLGRGRYVLDVQVVDKAGNKTVALARGTSRVVFFVA